MQYKTVRSARRSVSISIAADNTVTVRCPLNMPDSKVERFVEGKKAWIEKILNENGRKLTDNASVTAYNEIYLSGRKVPLVFSDYNLIEGSVYVKTLKDVKNLYITQLGGDLIERARNISEKTGFSAEGFSFKGYKSRWGCCSSKKQITFNYLLLMLPVQIQDYVIVHELCHTAVFNHSAAFWRLVENFIPNYKVLRRQLKRYDFIINLY